MNPIDAFKVFDEFFINGHVGAYPAPNFPPVDVSANNETKDLTFRVALAGYSKDEVKLSFKGDFLVLKLENNAKEEDEDKISVLKKGIRKSTGTWRLTDPSSKYETGKVTASFVDGILTVFIPAREEEKPKVI